MTINRDLILTTIKEVYPKYLKERILKRLEAECLISNEEDLLTNGQLSVDVSNDNDSEDIDETFVENVHFEKIQKAVTNNVRCISVIEKMEYELSYKYATLFELNHSLDDNVNNLIDKGLIINSESEDFTGDLCSNFDNLDRIKPSFKRVSDEVTALKYSHTITGYLRSDGDNKRTIKYPILVLIHKNLNVLEVRLDIIKGHFKNGDEYFYAKEIKIVKDWIEKLFSIELIPLNLQPIIDYISKKESPEVNVTAQAMNLKTGSKAVLDTGVNDEFILPLLGEFKNLIKENEELFNSNQQTQEILDKLETFIFETEETSDLPWISLSWAHQTKSKILKVKFSFNYKGQIYDLLQYYGSNAEMERMNDVTKYLIENKREYENENDDREEEGEIS